MNVQEALQDLHRVRYQIDYFENKFRDRIFECADRLYRFRTTEIEVHKVEPDNRHSLTRFGEIVFYGDDYVTIQGDEYWSYGGNETHTFDFPIKFLDEATLVAEETRLIDERQKKYDAQQQDKLDRAERMYKHLKRNINNENS